MSKKVIIITGASSGIGREFALQIDRMYKTIDEIWLIARNTEQLNKLSKQLSHKTLILDMDLTEESSHNRLTNAIIKNKARICMLINCAGYGLMGEYAKQPQKEALGMIRLNCESLTAVTGCCIPYMMKDSRIIQLASSAAFLPQADFAVYAATKSYVLSFSRALCMELKKKNIYVTAVCPGPVDTPFFERAEKNGTTLRIKKLTMAKSKEVVKKALLDSYKHKAVSVYGLPIQILYVSAKVLPHSLLLFGSALLKYLENKGDNKLCN